MILKFKYLNCLHQMTQIAVGISSICLTMKNYKPQLPMYISQMPNKDLYINSTTEHGEAHLNTLDLNQAVVQLMADYYLTVDSTMHK